MSVQPRLHGYVRLKGGLVVLRRVLCSLGEEAQAKFERDRSGGEKDEDGARARVDLTHQRDLGGALCQIGLVDAYGIDPEVSGLVESHRGGEAPQDGVQIASHEEGASRLLKGNQFRDVSPDVGEGIERRYGDGGDGDGCEGEGNVFEADAGAMRIRRGASREGQKARFVVCQRLVLERHIERGAEARCVRCGLARARMRCTMMGADSSSSGLHKPEDADGQEPARRQRCMLRGPRRDGWIGVRRSRLAVGSPPLLAGCSLRD